MFARKDENMSMELPRTPLGEVLPLNMPPRMITPLEAARIDDVLAYNGITPSDSDSLSVKSNWYVGQDSVGVTYTDDYRRANPSLPVTYSGGFVVARRDRVMPNVEKVIFNPPATVVIWNDGTKTVVKAKESGRKKSDKDAFSEEYGLAMAIAKRYFGSRSAFLKAVENAKRPGAE